MHNESDVDCFKMACCAAHDFNIVVVKESDVFNGVLFKFVLLC